mgnify:CR=1 FL=1
MLYSFFRFTLLFVLAIGPWMNSAASAQPSAAQFLQWLTYYTNSDIRADYNYDNMVTPADFSAFLINYDNPPQPPQPSDGWTELNPSSNSVVIYGPAELSRELSSIIRQLDIRRAQVLVEAVIAEVSYDRAKELGVPFDEAERWSKTWLSLQTISRWI